VACSEDNQILNQRTNHSTRSVGVAAAAGEGVVGCGRSETSKELKDIAAAKLHIDAHESTIHLIKQRHAQAFSERRSTSKMNVTAIKEGDVATEAGGGKVPSTSKGGLHISVPVPNGMAVGRSDWRYHAHAVRGLDPARDHSIIKAAASRIIACTFRTSEATTALITTTQERGEGDDSRSESGSKSNKEKARDITNCYGCNNVSVRQHLERLLESGGNGALGDESYDRCESSDPAQSHLSLSSNIAAVLQAEILKLLEEHPLERPASDLQQRTEELTGAAATGDNADHSAPFPEVIFSPNDEVLKARCNHGKKPAALLKYMAGLLTCRSGSNLRNSGACITPLLSSCAVVDFPGPSKSTLQRLQKVQLTYELCNHEAIQSSLNKLVIYSNHRR
jgi:hypothetical protein